MIFTHLIKSRATADTSIERKLSEKTHPNTRCRRITNTHFANTYDITSLLFTFIHQFNPNLNGPIKSISTHG